MNSDSPDPGLLAVVIPYFQRQSGVLRRALASVLSQQDCGLAVEVLVVDDSSPVPASAEVQGLEPPAGMVLRVLTRENGGPGAARNSALDALRGRARFVAFLDSDDEWSKDHLLRAVAALESGHDLYFTNLYQLDQSVGAFERAGKLKLEQHDRLTGAPADLYTFKTDMREQILFGNLIGTSTVVYRHEKFEGIRFLVEYRRAGEDYLFWLDLTTAGARIAFSTQVEAKYGRGVNVYAGAQWGTAEHLERVVDEIAYREWIVGHYDLDRSQADRLMALRRQLLEAFARSLISLLVNRRAVPSRLLMAHFRKRPFEAARLVSALFGKAFARHSARPD